MRLEKSKSIRSTAANRKAVLTPVPAAQYVRMSDEHQQYSIDNQKTAIQEFAALHNFVIIKTFCDAGRSGVIAKNRPALRQLLAEVLSGRAQYKAILVYDVSRWGRFPNNDEAAHYEFLCSNAGIPLHYCAEPFSNDGTASSFILKALKRSMAAEFSRELGDKVFRGKSRIAQLGFWVGGRPGIGYRRMMVSAEGNRKLLMKDGEQKSLTTDRVILVLGPPNEVELVREIFALACGGKGCTDIAQQLNLQQKLRTNGERWEACDVRNIINNPKYAGWNVWSRGSQRLRTRRIPNKQQDWIMKQSAFVPIVDQVTFDLAQARLPRRADRLWSTEEILKKVRGLLAKKGRLSLSLIVNTRGMPSNRLIRDRFGTFRELYRAIGYNVSAEDVLKHYRNADADRSMNLRRKLVDRLTKLFPKNVTVTHLPGKTRSILHIDNKFMVSVMLCPYQKIGGMRPYWMVRSNAAERDFVTLLCKLNANCTRLYSYRLFPWIDIPGRSHASYRNDRWLRSGIRLKRLSEFYAVATKLWAERSQGSIRPKEESTVDYLQQTCPILLPQ